MENACISPIRFAVTAGRKVAFRDKYFSSAECSGWNGGFVSTSSTTLNSQWGTWSFRGGRNLRALFKNCPTRKWLLRSWNSCQVDQRGQWVDSWVTKRSTFMCQNLSQMRFMTSRWIWHSELWGLPLERRSAAQFITPGRWTAFKARRFSWAQSRSLWATQWWLGDRRPPWWFI